MKNYLELYKDWIESGWFPYFCNYFEDDPFFELFIPTQEELKRHVRQDYDSYYAWGTRKYESGHHPSELRQHILLFMAAMNNEL